MIIRYESLSSRVNDHNNDENRRFKNVMVQAKSNSKYVVANRIFLQLSDGKQSSFESDILFFDF